MHANIFPRTYLDRWKWITIEDCLGIWSHLLCTTGIFTINFLVSTWQYTLQHQHSHSADYFTGGIRIWPRDFLAWAPTDTIAPLSFVLDVDPSNLSCLCAHRARVKVKLGRGLNEPSFRCMVYPSLIQAQLINWPSYWNQYLLIKKTHKSWGR